MRAQGEVHRGVISGAARNAVLSFYDDIQEGECHGRLCFVKHPELIEQIRSAVDLEGWTAYHDVFFSSADSKPVGWHNGQRSLSMLREPTENLSVWMPMVSLNEATGGRLVFLDTLDYSVPFFHFFRAVAKAGKMERYQAVYKKDMGSGLLGRARVLGSRGKTALRQAASMFRVSMSDFDERDRYESNAKRSFLESIGGRNGGADEIDIEPMYNLFLEFAIRERLHTAELNDYEPGDAFSFNSLNVHRVEPWLRRPERRATYVVRFVKNTNALVREHLQDNLRQNLESGRISARVISEREFKSQDVRWTDPALPRSAPETKASNGEVVARAGD